MKPLNPFWIGHTKLSIVFVVSKHDQKTATCHHDQEKGQSKVADQPMAPRGKDIRTHNVAGNVCVCFLVWGREPDLTFLSRQKIHYLILPMTFLDLKMLSAHYVCRIFSNVFPEHFYNRGKL